MLTRLLAIAFAPTMAIPAFAQDQAPAKMLRTGATVEKLEGQKLTVKTDTGEELSLTLPANLNVVRPRPARVADSQGWPVHRLHRGRGSRRQAARERDQHP